MPNLNKALDLDAKGQNLMAESPLSRDPFAAAKQKQNRLLDTAQALNPIESPFEKQMQMPVEPDTVEPQEPEVLSQSLIPKPSQKDETALSASGFNAFLNDQGLGDLAQGLSLTSMGRIQLIGRLASKFGPKFIETSQGMSVLARFEKVLAANSQESEKSFKRFAEQANRTIDMLSKVGR